MPKKRKLSAVAAIGSEPSEQSGEVGPLGLWLYAADYLRAAEAATEGANRIHWANYFLVTRSIELALKAFLSLQHRLMAVMTVDTGHDLRRVLAAAETAGLSKLVVLTAKDTRAVESATTYYVGKVFEYPAVGEALQGYPGLPNLAALFTVARKLVRGLEGPCRGAAVGVVERRSQGS